MKTRRKASPTQKVVDRLLRIVRRLRGKNGCPWDRKQTLESLKPELIEEAYEVIEALDSRLPERHAEELGDLLLHVVLQAEIQRENGNFDFADIADGISDKLIRRHPHVFGGLRVKDARQVLRNWERIKAAEKPEAETSILDGIPRHLPALCRAQRIQSRASRVGFDWKKTEDVLKKVEEEIDEVRRAIKRNRIQEIREEIGDVLFAIVNLSRFLGLDAESALRTTHVKFERRFREVERRIRRRGKQLTDCSLAEMDAIWEAIKRESVPRSRVNRHFVRRQACR